MTAGVAIVAVAVMAVAAAAERSRLAGSLTVLARLHWTLLPVGILLEALSMAAFAAMFRLLLTRGRVRPTRTSVLATIYAANAMSVSVPLAGRGWRPPTCSAASPDSGPAPCSRAGRCWRAE